MISGLLLLSTSSGILSMLRTASSNPGRFVDIPRCLTTVAHSPFRFLQRFVTMLLVHPILAERMLWLVRQE